MTDWAVGGSAMVHFTWAAKWPGEPVGEPGLRKQVFISGKMDGLGCCVETCCAGVFAGAGTQGRLGVTGPGCLSLQG